MAIASQHPRPRDTAIIPELELRKAEKKCTILAELDEEFRHIIDKLERRFGVKVQVQVIRPVVGGGAGSERILISAVQELDAQVSSSMQGKVIADGQR